MSTLHAHVVDVLGIAILVRTQGSRFRVETAPRWLSSLIEGVGAGHIVDVVERFPFLDTFMPDAESIWEDPIPGIETSDIWVEQRSGDIEIPLEALATRSQSECLLMLRIPWAEYEEKREFLTKARTTRLEHDRLWKEIQKKEILLHCIVHDLATPLTGIRGSLDLLARRPVIEPGDAKLLNIALRLCDDQNRLIRSILEAFAPELEASERDTLDPARAAEARGVVRQTVEAMLPAATVRNLDLASRVGDSIGDGDLVHIEASSLERALLNLVENAIRHSPRGGTVTLAAERNGGGFTFSVSDQGPGVDPEIAERLFERFAQGGKGRGKMGIGLFFCKLTATKWGGEIGQENLPEGGCRFWISLPAFAGGTGP